MLIVATVVFLYYTVWTLLMVRRAPSPYVSNAPIAICRRRPPSARALSSARLGHQDSGHPHSPGRRRGWLVLVAGHDTEQPQEGSEGEAGQDLMAFGAGRWRAYYGRRD